MKYFILFFFCKIAYSMDIGVSVHINDYLGSPSHYFQLTKSCGFNSYRDGMSWNRVEHNINNFNIFPDSMKLDESISSYTSNKTFNMLYVLGYGHKNHTNNDYPQTKEQVDEFIKYVDWVSKRFKGKIKYYEVWNEWLLGTGLRKDRLRPSDDIFIYLVEKSYLTIKKNDPSALVLTGSINPLKKNEYDWMINLLIDGRILPYIDGISVHPYSFMLGKKESSAEYTFEQIDDFQKKMTGVSGRVIPLYVTEFGFPTKGWRGWKTYYLEYQNIIKFLLLSKESGYIHGVWIYDLLDDGTNPSVRDEHFGLYNIDSTPKDNTTVVCKYIRAIRENKIKIHKNNTNEYDLFDNDELLFSWKKGYIYSAKLWEQSLK